MASRFDYYTYARLASYGSIKELHDIDGISWEQLSEWAGYGGPSSLKNIINQEAHNLDFARGCMLLKQASKVGNLRVHKHLLDTIQWEIVPRGDDVAATGSLETEIAIAMKALGVADDAVKVGNVDLLIDQYRNMQGVLAKMRAEIESMQSKMKKL